MTEVVLDRDNRDCWMAVGPRLGVRVLADDDANVIHVRHQGVEWRGTFDREWLAGHLGEWMPVDTLEWGPARVEVTALADDPADTIRVRRA